MKKLSLFCKVACRCTTALMTLTYVLSTPATIVFLLVLLHLFILCLYLDASIVDFYGSVLSRTESTGQFPSGASALHKDSLHYLHSHS